MIAQAKSFEEDLIFFDTDTLQGDMRQRDESEEGSAYAALVLGTRDYVRKCGFKRVVLGLSGGIDSALTACIAVDALGARTSWASPCPVRIRRRAASTMRSRWPGISTSSAN